MICPLCYFLLLDCFVKRSHIHTVALVSFVLNTCKIHMTLLSSFLTPFNWCL
jgi:hypothetical protein